MPCVKALMQSGSWLPARIDVSVVGFDGDAGPSNPLLAIGACNAAASLSTSLVG